jgi:hypothetical protein
VLRKGRLVASGGPELAEELERTGYAGYDDDEDHAGEQPTAVTADPFADPLL